MRIALTSVHSANKKALTFHTFSAARNVRFTSFMLQPKVIHNFIHSFSFLNSNKSRWGHFSFDSFVELNFASCVFFPCRISLLDHLPNRKYRERYSETNFLAMLSECSFRKWL